MDLTTAQVNLTARESKYAVMIMNKFKHQLSCVKDFDLIWVKNEI